ncbi:hypothetical protein KM043_009152 [Ampulex compressa]|nr:hypothetical protein KM043_009152 [Ampulex compressa]
MLGSRHGKVRMEEKFEEKSGIKSAEEGVRGSEAQECLFSYEHEAGRSTSKRKGGTNERSRYLRRENSLSTPRCALSETDLRTNEQRERTCMQHVYRDARLANRDRQVAAVISRGLFRGSFRDVSG